MTMFSALRNRLSDYEAGDEPESAASRPAPNAEARLPYAGYDRLDAREVTGGLSDHSQVELEAAEAYERSHENRERVLDKLRFMRQREPLPGYDALSVEEIVAALEEADMPTIKKVRGYERKFANRPAVLDQVVRVHHRHLAAHPAGPAPGSQSLSAESDDGVARGGAPG